MYYLADFARKTGSKDKTKRKKRVSLKTVGTIAGLTLATGLAAGAGAKLGEKYLLKGATKKLNKQLRSSIRNQRFEDKLTNSQRYEGLSNSLKGNKSDSLETQANNQIKALQANKYYSDNLAKTNKNNRRNVFKEDYAKLRTKKRELGSALGVGTLGLGLAGSGIYSNKKKKNKK